MSRAPDSRGGGEQTRPYRVDTRLHDGLDVRMKSRAEFYRRCGLVAKQRAAHCTDLSLKEAFKDVARHWLALAERVDWLDRQHNGQQNLITYTSSRTR
jgi:hypothetical protein